MKEEIMQTPFFKARLNNSGIFEYESKQISAIDFSKKLLQRKKKKESSNRESTVLERVELDLLDIFDQCSNELLIRFSKAFNKIRYEDLERMIDDCFNRFENLQILEECYIEGERIANLEVFSKSLFSRGEKIAKLSNFLKDSVSILKAQIKQDLSSIVDLKEIVNESLKKQLLQFSSKWSKSYKIISHSSTQKAFDRGKINVYENHFVGEEIKVFRQPETNACRKCVELYTNLKTGKPKIFKLKQLVENGSNYGKAYRDWKAVIGDTHPFCNCSLKISKR